MVDQKDQIASLAYELYIKSGRIEGRDLENWLEAERVLLSRNTANAPVAELRKEPPAQKPPVLTAKPPAKAERLSVPKSGKKGKRERV